MESSREGACATEVVRDTRVCHYVPCIGFEAYVGGSNEEGED